MRKTNLHPELNPGLMTSKPAHQTLSHNHQTKVCPLVPSYSCSGRCLTSNLTLQTTQIMCRQNPVRNRPVTPSRQSRSHGGWIYPRWLLNILSCPGKDVLSLMSAIHRPDGGLSFSFPLDRLGMHRGREGKSECTLCDAECDSIVHMLGGVIR